MYLKGVEISGFKSFGERINISFDRGITSIVGPNGSGKSNILDGILWVLGEQSYKNIRAKESKDIIFSGGEGKKPANCAEVSLHIDNKDNFLPVELEKVKITRKMFQNGENEYLLNDKKIRLKDINELFLDTGVGKSAYSVIGQGKVERIISSSNKELKGIIEEAAGIKKFQQNKLEAIKKLNSLQEELEKIDLILKELKINRDKMEKQSLKAKEYLELEKKVNNISKYKFTKENQENKEKKSNLDKGLNQLLQNLEKNVNDVKEDKDILEQVSFKKNQLKIEVEKFIEKNIELKTSIEKLEREKIKLKERQESYKREFQDKNEIEKNLKIKTIEKNKEIESLIEEKKSIEKEIIKLDKENNDFENNINRFIKNRDSLIIDKDTKKNKLMDLEVTNLKLLNEIENSGRRLKGSLGKIENLQNEKIQLLDKEKEEEKIYENILFEKNKIKKIYSDLEKEITENEENISIISREINNYSKELRELEFQEKRNKEKYNSLQRLSETNEGFYKGVKEILNKKISGVHGAFISLIEVPEKLEKAIEASIAGNLQDIVVETSDVAKKCIEELKKSKSGRASFLPLDIIKESKLREYIDREGILGRGSDLISYDKKYSNIVKSLLGNILIVENLDIGLSILKENKFNGNIVTLGGELLSGRGRITGGDTNNSSVSQIFERKKDIKILKTTLEKLSLDINEIKNKLKSSNEKLNDIEERLLSCDLEKDKVKREINKIDEDENNQKKKIERIHKELKVLEIDILEEENYHKEYSKKIEENEQIKNSTEELIKNLKELMIEDENQIYQLNKKIELEKNKFSDTKILYLNIKDKFKNIEKIIFKEELEIKNISEENNKICIRIEEIKKELENIVKTSDNIEKELINISNLHEKENKELLNSKKEIETLEIKEKELLLKTQNIEKIIYEDKSKVHLLKKDLEDVEEKIKIIEKELHNLRDIEVIDLQDIEKYTSKDLENFKLKLLSFETVNLLSIEEFDEVNKKYEFMINQKIDLTRGEKSLGKLIKDVSMKIEERFYKAYTEINENFNRMCVETLDNSEGKLTLTNGDDFENCGVEISVKFKNKKMQSLSLLSGGEKSMVAVAFIMSIFMYRPSPFAFLDEIEAALDEKNTRKLISKLKEFTEKSQFIMITHNKETMRSSDSLYGVTMNKKIGISKLVPVKL
ncbi:chromosome segregation protein SMC [Cetobacterium sp. SF1]|uniref:chromosome segregation protein SMC n=1 Tax=Cetobacterium sp. SF1 TaxID=3417654 RepID=UPI003CE93268